VLWLVLSPVIGAVLLLIVRRQPPEALRSLALMNAFFTALIATGLHVGMALSDADHPMSAVIEWTWLAIPRDAAHPSDPWLEATFSIGCDQINAAPLLWIPWLALSALWVVDARRARPRPFYGVFFAWETCLLGCFAAYDALTFLGFEAAALWLGHTLVSGWGTAERHAVAAKFWRYQFAGQVAWGGALIALGVIGAWCRFDVLPTLPTLKWSWPALAQQLPWAAHQSEGALQFWLSSSPVLVVLLVVGALLRSPVVPLHRWLPAFFETAPAPVCVLIAAAWCPLSLYAWARFAAALFGENAAALRGAMALLGGATAVYAGLCALAQSDLRRLSAYALVTLQGAAWLSASTLTVGGSHGAWILSHAAGVGSAAWLLLAALWEQRERTPLAAGAVAMPRFAALVAAAMLIVCGFPALGRLSADLVVGWTLAQHDVWGLVAVLFGWLMVGASAIGVLGRLWGTDAEAADATVGSPRDVSWREALALAPVLAWIIWSLSFALPAWSEPTSEWGTISRTADGLTEVRSDP
jgi:NADH-quinone oxidoreductase subunit M